MTELEWLKTKKKDFVLENMDPLCLLAYYAKYNIDDCKGVCEDCEFSNFDKCADYLSQEHEIPIKLKQWEFDILSTLDQKQKLYEQRNLCAYNLKCKGYFKGLDNRFIKYPVKHILENCKIVPDDYDFSEVK